MATSEISMIREVSLVLLSATISPTLKTPKKATEKAVENKRASYDEDVTFFKDNGKESSILSVTGALVSLTGLIL